MDPFELLRIAEHLASGGAGSGRGRPPQAELRRAVSAAYYAMFHALAACCADMLVGATRASRSQQACRQTYRALEHSFAKNQCANQGMMGRFPQPIQEFARYFVDIQRHRHVADYDPDPDQEYILTREKVLQIVDEVSRTINDFQDVDVRDRRAFSIFVLLRFRRD